MKDGNFKMIATTFKGLERVLQREILELGGQKPRVLVRAVEFYGDTGFLYKANLKLSTALRILKPIAHLRNIKSVTSLYTKVKDIPWETFFHSRKSIYFHVSGELAGIPNTRFISQTAKDAIVDRFREKYGNRPDIDKENPQVVINLHLFRNQMAVSLDSSGQPLFKRGYRTGTGPAPLNEVMAAGIIQLARWKGDTHLIDPMTGSGTIPIEAALRASHIPVNFYRKEFAFMHWHGFDQHLFDLIKNSLLKRMREPTDLIQIIGSDKNPAMIETARNNAKQAGVEDFIQWEVKDFFQTHKIPGPVTLLFNPPYNRRLELQNKNAFFEKIARHLSGHFPLAQAWILSPEQLNKYFKQKPLASYELINGKIPVYFQGFDL